MEVGWLRKFLKRVPGARLVARRIPKMRRVIRFGNWRIPISPSRLKIRRWTFSNNRIQNCEVAIGNYRLPVSVVDWMHSRNAVRVLSMGLGFDVSFDSTLRKVFGESLFLVGIEPFERSCEFARNASIEGQLIFDVIIRVAIATEDRHSVTIGNPEGRSFKVLDPGELVRLRKRAKSRVEKVEAISFNSLIERLGGSAFDLIKIDIERNAEKVVRQILTEHHPVVVVIEIERNLPVREYLETLNDLLSLMSRLGYEYSLLKRRQFRYLSVELVAYKADELASFSQRA